MRDTLNCPQYTLFYKKTKSSRWIIREEVLLHETHLETESFPGIAFDSQSPFVEGNNLFYNRETYPDSSFAWGTTRLVHLIEFLAYKSDLFPRDPSPIVAESQEYLSVPLARFDGQCFLAPRVFYEIREDIVDELDELPFVEMQEGRRMILAEYDMLVLLGEQGSILVLHVLYELPEIDFGYLQSIPIGLFELLVLHDGSCDLDQTIDLFVQEGVVFRARLDDTIVHPFQIALDGGYRSLDLVTEIREEIGAYFLLMGEVFIERIDRVDKRSKLIFLLVFDLLISFSRDDVWEVFDDGSDGTEGFMYPEPRNQEYHQDYYDIHDKHGSDDLQDEQSFGSGIAQKREVEHSRKKRVQSLDEEDLFYGVFRNSYLLKRIYDRWSIVSWVFREVFQRARYSGEIRENLFVLLYRRIIEILCLCKGSK